MRGLIISLLFVGLTALSLGGCDSGDAGDEGTVAEVPAIGGAVGEPLIGGGAEDPVMGGGSTTDDGAEPDEILEPPPAAYPEGPYGKSNFDIIEDLAFFDPWAVKWRTFGDLHNNPDVKMVIVSSSAGWCPACKTEAAHLVDYYDEFQADGLEVYFTIFEDNAGKDMVVGNEVTPAGMQVMNSWKADFGIDYPFFIDVQKSLRAYQIDGGVPLTMIITTDDMMIRYIDEGYSSAFIENKILLYLYNN